MVQDHVFPQDGDFDDAANFGQLAGQAGSSGFIQEGAGLTADFTVPEVTVDTGVVFVTEAVDTATQAGEDRLNVAYTVQLSSRTVSLTDNAINHVFVDVDTGANDTVSVVVNTTGTAPSNTALKIGEVNTSANTTSQQWYLVADDGTLTFPTEAAIDDADARGLIPGTITFDRETDSTFLITG